MGTKSSMRHKLLAGSLLLATLVCAPAWSQESAPAGNGQAANPSLDLESVAKRLSNYFTEEELNTLFDYLRDVSIAALQGKGDDVLMPPDLAFKMAVLQERMMREGQYQMQLMMKQMEREIDKALKDMFTFPSPDANKKAAPAKPPATTAPPAAPAKPINPYAPQPAPQAVPQPAPAPELPVRTGNPYMQR